MVNIIKQKSVGTCEWHGVSFTSCTVLFIGMVSLFYSMVAGLHPIPAKVLLF